MPDSCPKCGAEFDKPLAAGDRCPDCGYKLPSRRRDDDDEDDRDERPRRRRDDDDDRPRRRRPAKKQGGGVGKVLLILGGAAALMVLVCCGGIGLYIYLGPKEVEVLDAGRQSTPDGGTASVTVNLRVGATRPGNMVMGDYILMCKAGSRTTVQRVSLRGDGGGEYRTTIFTPELAKEPGPVEFWVERDDRGSTSKVSRVRKIP